jgi:dipeptidase D
MTFVASLEPNTLWQHFDAILTIPRGSKCEDQIREHVVSIAERNSLSYQVDGAGNVVVRKPGTAGHETAPVTVLQAHLDMVNEKNSDVEHDFTKDAIKPQRDGDYLTASGTTLGSDNGIGVATMLAVMEASDLVHGPLECLFTIDEETGLTGAAQLEPGLLEGRQLLNLDSEEEGILYVGCAGGGDTKLTLALTTTPTPAGATALRVTLRGLKGGHSGCDIHLQRGNGVQLLARALWAASLRTRFHLASLDGGSAHNAIPREAFATVVVGAAEVGALTKAMEEAFRLAEVEFGAADPNMQFEVSATDLPGEAWDEATAQKVMQLVTSLPHGVTAMSHDIPDLVETSTNLATVKQRNGTLEIGLSSRSSIDSALEALRQRIRAAGLLAGSEVEEDEAYPGWKPDLGSRLLDVVKRVHLRVLGSEPEVKAIHAGLECGIIGKKIPGMDMISLGPQIEFPHSPDERVHIDSVAKFWRLLAATLEELA